MTPVDLIIGAGPAGLTAAYELLEAGAPPPLVVEADEQVGGISKTIFHNGYRMDLGGHRFFSKSDWVMNWWQEMLPIASCEEDLELTYQSMTRSMSPRKHPVEGDRAFLVRPRMSRIYYGRKFYDYPVKLNANTVSNLGFPRMARIAASYAQARIVPRTPELSLEDFLINRFGQELYLTFFRDYTEKVWGVSCREISAEWGRQRIKGLSVAKALLHAASTLISKAGGIRQKSTETSLIERFLYPVLGPGQLWEEVATRVESRGGQIRLRHRVMGLNHDGSRIESAIVQNLRDGEQCVLPVRHVISTMPMTQLAEGLTPSIPDALREITRAIPYRDFITVGLLVQRMTLANRSDTHHANGMPPDNWIYVQEPDVALGRVQIFNNWSPGMVADPSKIWLGLEYFCNAGDDLWQMEDDEFSVFAARELEKIGLIDHRDVLDAKVIRVPKAYPAYFGAYERIGEVREYFDRFENLFLVGRNGMHRYNNQDHSMLAAKKAVEIILTGGKDKEPIWEVNVEDDYHEEK